MQSTITAKTESGTPAMGWLHHAPGTPDTLVVIIHGHNTAGDRGRYITLAKWFEHHGMDALRWNSVRESIGEDKWRIPSITEEIAQARAILAKVGKHRRVVLVGHSQGALVALALAAEGLATTLVQIMPLVDVKASVGRKLKRIGSNVDALATQPSVEVVSTKGEVFVYERAFMEDLASFDVPALYAKWRGPTMVVKASRDDAIPESEVDQGFALANEPKELVIVDDVHRFSEETATMLAANIVAWLRQNT